MTADAMSSYAYLDYAATAPLCEEAAAALAPYQVPGLANLPLGANANSLHGPGRAAFAALEEARKALAGALGARRPSEVILTAGATEADNAALLGMALAARELYRRAGKGDVTPHVIVSAIEHDAVLAPAKRLEALGFSVTRLRPDAAGFIEVRALEQALTPHTVLVSVQAANSEVGSIQPIRQLAACAHEAGALFHTDAVQALGKMPLDLAELDVDAASFSAHKIGGPKGVGALYLRARRRRACAAARRTWLAPWASRRPPRPPRRQSRTRSCASAPCVTGSTRALPRSGPSRPRWTWSREAATSCPTSCTCL